MKKPYFYFIAGAATVLLPVGVFFLLIWALSFAVETALTSKDGGKDDVYILNTSNSPNQKLIVTTFSYSGGGAAGWSGIKVNVRKSEEIFDSKEYVFSTYGGTKIQTDWESDKTLRISYSPDTNRNTLSLYQKVSNTDKTVNILYVRK